MIDFAGDGVCDESRWELSDAAGTHVVHTWAAAMALSCGPAKSSSPSRPKNVSTPRIVSRDCKSIGISRHPTDMIP